MMYPDDPLQPGPIYFLVQRRCGLFGVHAEGLSSQVNYLIDEAASTGKGANCVISYMHHYLTQFGLGEKEMHLHADNCVGQNKNSFMMQYLAWRVLSGLHTTISIHFMLAGHTKFAPDWCFGLIKPRLRRTRVSCMSDIAELVDAIWVCSPWEMSSAPWVMSHKRTLTSPTETQSSPGYYKVRGFAKKKIQKIQDYYGIGWVGPGLARNFCVCGKSSQNSPKPVLIFCSSIPCVFYLYIHCYKLLVIMI